MGVRLVMFDKAFAAVNGSNVPDPNDHNVMANRDMKNQHPIWAISGLQDTLNEIEDLIRDTNTLVLQIQEWCKEKMSTWQQQLDDLSNYVSKLRTVDHILDTDTVDMVYDESTRTLSANVRVFPDEHNAVQALYGGIYVPKIYAEDTNSIRWVGEYSGESLEEIFAHSDRFSHGDGWKNEANVTEMSSWYWDAAQKSFRQPMNTGTYNGFVTEKAYDRYVHRVTITSTDGDDDTNGVVVGYIKDADGNPHTLSVIVGRTGVNSWTWALVYDFLLPDTEVVATCGNGTGGTVPGNYGSGGWAGHSIMVEVTKEANIVTASCSDWDNIAINPSTKISINLDDYWWGYLFRDKVKYGYSNFSQAQSYYKNTYFKSREISDWTVFKAYVKISEKENNGITQESDGIWTEKFLRSNEDGNILEKKSDGWFVPDVINISKEAENIIVRKKDGLYVPDQIHVIRKRVVQNGHGFAVGDFIYYDPTKGYQKALAVDDYTINIVGIVVIVTDVNNFEFQWAGFVSTNLFTSSNGFIQGKPVYISATQPGKVTQEQPEISKAVGYPVENTGIVVSIERGIQYNMEHQIGDFKNYTTAYNVRSDGFIKVYEGIDYKATMITALISSLNDEFKATYMIYDADKDSYQFKNTEELRTANFTPYGMNLFIKAF